MKTKNSINRPLPYEKVIKYRADYFRKIMHKYEAQRLEECLRTLKELIPPENWNVGNTLLSSGWISVDERPLFTKDDKGNWTCTEDGDKEFIAALPYNDSKRPNEELWWIRHCVLVDETGLCVVTDDDTEPAGWNLEDVTHWMPMPEPPSGIVSCRK